MTHDYKAALDWFDCKDDSNQTDNILAIRHAITIAAEYERVKKERDELARAVLLADYQGVSDDVLELAKKVRDENGNA